jgi:hypothetical protein
MSLLRSLVRSLTHSLTRTAVYARAPRAHIRRAFPEGSFAYPTDGKAKNAHFDEQNCDASASLAFSGRTTVGFAW